VQVHTEDIQKQAEDDLLRLICDTYQVILAAFLPLLVYSSLCKIRYEYQARLLALNMVNYYSEYDHT